ncbi:26S proteasome non-ATPase regulatory subunit 1 isoform X1 [Drosophila biarmipes]|uniref:26S proteasome non-ATPase regulatory subunit 1 isoform X1 n=1 Tax=Drosophila biarmipes TaxID=125945 RepID=UPI0007E677C2|nr:26S proteasome non-ATPase regulatory subunit 1 isoform X1 [Drosophila biarmipes]XP_016952712.1 26S proteasome non-ATPase regulatory subunit 1 isoform X1 [Drosophila biarmipes]
MSLTSAAGIISLLDEPMPDLKVFALKKLDNIVDEFWPEISESIEKIEMLHEDRSFPENKLAGMVASKVFYHLGSFEDALTYALGAGDLFDVNARNEYTETIIAKCIDFYIAQRVEFIENPKEASAVDERLEGIVNRMIQRCLDDNQFRQALGIALETRRMDTFKDAIMKSDDVRGMLAYAYNVTMSLIQNRGFRNEVLRCLVSLYRDLGVPDYVNMCQCLIFLEDPYAVAEMLDTLTRSSVETNNLMAYQIAFDLYESATQEFLGNVLQHLKNTAPIPTALPSTFKPQGTTSEDGARTEGEKSKADEDITEEKPADDKVERTIDSLNEVEKLHQKNIEKLISILSGEVSIDLQLQFLIRSNHADLQVLRGTKEAVRVSICHTATVIANAFMHSGTTSDQFLRDNLDWLARATNWAKLTATASLGVIHRGHEKDSLALMQSYLPKEAGPSSGYSEGGALYALGLIHANHGANIIDYLLQQLKDAQNENVRHGGCLGLGLAGMGTHRQDLYEQLKFNLYQDDAVTGEAAGIAMGMVMLGSKNAQAIEDMVSYAQETQHEKILRGLAVGISLTMFSRLEEADPLVTSLSTDKDPVLRRSGMYTIAMAYNGTGSNKAIRKLLHVAVSDVNDDVRRAAVTAIGFILFRTPEQCPSVVSLLAESYNPHVRYGAAMALGIACAGTGLREAIALLEPMVKFDPVNFVRQGALIASAMILIQHTDQSCPKSTFFRQLYAEVISNKHEDVMAKYGAILAQGIIDAGGRNATLSLQSRTGHTNLQAVVGMLAFTQYWYWFPLAHTLSLAFTPTCVIGLNSDLKMPKMEYKSAAKPSLYAYPAPLEEKKSEEREKVATAVLSIAARQKRRENADKKEDEKMDVDEDSKEGAAVKKDEEGAKTDEKPATEEKPKKKEEKEKKKDEEKDKEAAGTSSEKEKEKEKDKKEKKEPEPTSEILQNPARVLRQQLKVLSIIDGQSYEPLKDVTIGGIIVFQHTGKAEDQELVEPVAAFGPMNDEEKEPEPPEPFEYIED